MSIINKKKLNEYLALSNELVIEVLEENKNSYKILIKGDKSKMKFKDNGFSEKQLEQLGQLMDSQLTYALNPIVKDIKELKQDMKEVKSRLDVLEKDVKEIKSLPTIQKELKNK